MAANDIVITETHIVDNVLATRCRLGEGPHWDPISHCLFFVDISNKRVHRYDPSYKKLDYFEFEETATSVHTVKDHKNLLCVTLAKNVVLYDMATKTIVKELITIPGSDKWGYGVRINDCKCDPKGRLLIGTKSVNDGSIGGLYVLDLVSGGQPQLKQLINGALIGNGLGWTPDGKTFFWTDTLKQKIWKYPYNVETGTFAGDPTVLYDFSAQGYHPDGLAVDSNGDIWSAIWGASCLVKIDGKTGDALDEIKMPVPQPTSCCFASKGLEEMYVTTASVSLDEDKLAEHVQSGDVFKITVGVSGTPCSQFVVNTAAL
eukprot:Clim_evm39s88 gene=Clim_evmTU39s88